MNEVNQRYLSFRLAGEIYAVPLLEVKEVLQMPDIVPVPRSGRHIVGITNLRGRVITITDLREKFGLKKGQDGQGNAVIFEYENLSIGLVVDRVEGVISVSSEQMSPPPEGEHARAMSFVTAIIRRDERLILVLDVLRALDMSALGARRPNSETTNRQPAKDVAS